MASWVDEFKFGEEFWDLRNAESADHARLLEVELDAELSRTHPLHGLDARVVAKALPQDEVALVAGDVVALVHLTWSGHRETPPFPKVEFVDSAAAFRELVEFRYQPPDSAAGCARQIRASAAALNAHGRAPRMTSGLRRSPKTCDGRVNVGLWSTVYLS